MTKTICGADSRTDHRLFVSKLNLRIQPVRRVQGMEDPKRLNVSKLKPDNKRLAFLNEICNHLDAVQLSSKDPEENWTVFPNAAHSSALQSTFRKDKDWLNENDEEKRDLLEENYRLHVHKAHQDDTSSVSENHLYESRADSRACKFPG